MYWVNIWKSKQAKYMKWTRKHSGEFGDESFNKKLPEDQNYTTERWRN